MARKNHHKVIELTDVKNVDVKKEVYMTSTSTTDNRTHP